MASWAGLPQDLALLVSQQLGTGDILQARAACRDWQAAFQHAALQLAPLTLDSQLLATFPAATEMNLLSRHASHRLSLEGIKLLSQFQHLAVLAVGGEALLIGLAVELLQAVQQCTSLTALMLKGFARLSPHSIVPAMTAALTALPRLRRLKLQDTPLPFTALRGYSNLQELTVEGEADSIPPMHVTACVAICQHSLSSGGMQA